MLTAKESYLNDINLIKETARQIIKDFKIHGLELEFSGNTESAYDEMFDQIFPALDELINSDYGKFLSLLYQIDISEKQVGTLLEEYPKSHYSKGLTKLILEREFRKVLTKHYFQKKNLRT
ncbi:hypothetical protein ACFL6I_25400 [candidate division KSB1 bacterium]